ncbi:FtsX-like permease family protein [Leifsonia virtsii]|uniref:FtsX-like permease family protein n=1 Tax=Leifsonia virtsii TaxID=3035915 RepID=A0ABT8J280_9MICO|nr:FtsX-like permease family protein [Leifsonia virtsii]MDN4599195.1 FtsX-like permease family protein [Leifsonia virtsii]
MSGRTTDAGLLLRSARAYGGGLALLAVVALVTTLALAAWPRVTSTILGGELRHDLVEAGAGGRDIVAGIRTGTFTNGPEVDPAQLWQDLPASATAVRDAMRPSLRAVASPGDIAARSLAEPTDSPAGAAPNSRYSVTVEAYPDLRRTARLVSGEWPTAPSADDAGPVPVVLTATAASLLGWHVGESRTATPMPGVTVPLRLVGTIRPVDRSADFWDLDVTRALGHFVDGGDSGKDYGGVAWVAPQAWPALAARFDATIAQVWFPVVPDRFTAEELPQVRSALGAFLASPRTAAVSGASVPLTFATALQQPLDDYTARAQPAQTLFAILVSGPLVVALAVLAQAARLVVDRRRPALSLMAARGASPARLRTELAAHGLLASLPAAAIGLAAALLLTPGAVPLALPMVLAVLCVLLPPAALLLAAGRLEPAPETRRRNRFAWVAEVVVLGLAVAGIALVARRGLDSSGGGMQVDPLTALTPVLVALAACILVVRLAGYPVGWVAGALRRGRGAVAFLGASSARHARSGLLWPVFTLVAGVGIALFSVSMLATTGAGLAEGARIRVGSDLSLTAASTLSGTQVDAVARIPGVQRTATVDWAGGLRLSAAGDSSSVSGYLVDPRALDAVQADLPRAARLSTALTGVLPGRTGAALGGSTSRIPITSALVQTSGTNVHLGVKEVDFVPGVYVRDAEWVFIDKTTLPASSGITGRPQTVLVKLAPGADAARVHAELERIGGRGAVVGDAVAERAALRASPLVAGSESIAALSIALTLLLCIAALLLTLVLNTAARIRLVATLRTIGYSSRQTAGVLAWELGPVLVFGLAAGAVVGLVLPALVLSPLDLRGFTGSPVQPAVVQDPTLVGAALAGFALVAAVATAVALAGARRRSAAAVLRNGGE